MNNIPQQMGCPPRLLRDSQHELEAQRQINRPRPREVQQQQQPAPEEQNDAEPTEENECKYSKHSKKN